jgi:CDP-diacylglycerol--serine O-phosphatidyltransferase
MKSPHFSMIRGFHLADVFTLGNAACGTAAVFAVLRQARAAGPGLPVAAFVLIAAAFIFDVLDGQIARWRHTHSPMGRELDSLSDVISFGVAPAAVGFAAGLDGGWDQLVLLFFVACGVARLARYNITAEALAGGGPKVKYFEGTPIPTSILLVAILGLAALRERVGEHLWLGVIDAGPFRFHPLVLMYALSGSLMVSKTIRIPKP